MKNLTLTLCFVLAGMVSSAQSTWGFDKAHSRIQFNVDHMVISEVTGQFRSYDGTVTTKGDDFEDATIEFSIDAASIDTDNETRDKDLRSENFFDVKQYPDITFSSSAMTKLSADQYRLTGKLTMHGVTREVELDVTYGGMVQDPWGNTRAGFKVTGTLNRRDFGLTYSAALETGGLVVGDEIRLVCNIELIRQKG